MIVHDIVQRSPEWHAVRCGRLCGSRAADMMATFKSGGEAAARRNLRVQLVLERITGRSQDRGFVNAAMQDGIDREPDALALYEATMTDRAVMPVGFVAHDSLLAGCSPDGVIGDFEGLVEAKCPIPATHLDYLRTGVVPQDYLKQIVHNLWITGAQWCDWISFHPEFPEHLQLKLVRVPRDEKAIEDYEAKARAFLVEVERELQTLSTLTNLRSTLEAAVA